MSTKYGRRCNLAAEMSRGDYTAADVARAAGVKRDTATKWLRGETAPNVFQALSVARALFPDLTIEYLFAD